MDAGSHITCITTTIVSLLFSLLYCAGIQKYCISNASNSHPGFSLNVAVKLATTSTVPGPRKGETPGNDTLRFSCNCQSSGSVTKCYQYNTSVTSFITPKKAFTEHHDSQTSSFSHLPASHSFCTSPACDFHRNGRDEGIKCPCAST